jgi:tRNA A37 threonylcarbamoyladenosine dehydratase
VIEPDLLDLSNLNRYALALRSMVGCPKTDVLTSFATPAILCRSNTRLGG